MKYFFTIILFLTVLYSYGQENSTYVGTYKWQKSVVMQRSSIDGITTNEYQLSKGGQKFKVIKVQTDGLIIKVLDYTIELKKPSPGTKKYISSPDFFSYNFDGSQTQYDSLTIEQANSRSYASRQKYFKISFEDLNNFAVPETFVKSSLAVGIINFPFKFRPQNQKDFSGAFNFGAALGLKFGHRSNRRFTFTFLTGYSISNVVIEESAATMNSVNLNSTNNFSAFSFSSGLMVEYDKIQAGVFMGWDYLSRINQEQYGWIYQGETWFSIGFGYSIFSNENSTTSTDNQN